MKYKICYLWENLLFFLFSIKTFFLCLFFMKNVIILKNYCKTIFNGIERISRTKLWLKWFIFHKILWKYLIVERFCRSHIDISTKFSLEWFVFHLILSKYLIADYVVLIHANNSTKFYLQQSIFRVIVYKCILTKDLCGVIEIVC